MPREREEALALDLLKVSEVAYSLLPTNAEIVTSNRNGAKRFPGYDIINVCGVD